MICEFYLEKMFYTYEDTKVNYFLSLGDTLISMNELIGTEINIKSLNEFKCECGSILVSPFKMGFCRKCFYESPMASDTIFKPELSKAHLGIKERDLEWEKKFQLRPHIVYLAETDKMKVGVTRKEQIPTRWIDQGATQAIAIAEVPNRYLAGIVEVSLKEYFADKTAYRRMILKANTKEENVLDFIPLAMKNIPKEALNKLIKMPLGEKVWGFEYPISDDIQKINSTKIESDTEVKGKLTGIKGQYLIFDNENILNIRSNKGKKVKFSI